MGERIIGSKKWQETLQGGDEAKIEEMVEAASLQSGKFCRVKEKLSKADWRNNLYQELKIDRTKGLDHKSREQYVDMYGLLPPGGLAVYLRGIKDSLPQGMACEPERFSFVFVVRALERCLQNGIIALYDFGRGEWIKSIEIGRGQWVKPEANGIIYIAAFVTPVGPEAYDAFVQVNQVKSLLDDLPTG